MELNQLDDCRKYLNDALNLECDNTKIQNEDVKLNEAIDYCIEKWGTHSLIHSQTAVYGECSFPSWVICEDQLLQTWECDYKPNLENIDTEEKRFAACEENVSKWINDMWELEIKDIEWNDESEWWASFVRNGLIKYTKDWENQKIKFECVADFVDWSVSVTYDEEEIDK